MGGTLASATGRAPEGHWKPQETRFTLFYLAETNFQKTRSRNGHTDDHPTTYLLKIGGYYYVSLPRQLKEVLHDQSSKKILVLLTTRSPSHTLLPLDSFWGSTLAAVHYDLELHTVHLKWMEPVKDLKLHLCSFVQENSSLL